MWGIENEQMNKNSYLIALCESELASFGKVEFLSQSEPQQVFSAIWELESQVNNGGFDQYLRNSDTDIITHAPAALRAIGAHQCAQIVQSALSVLEPFPSTRDERSDALDDLDDERLEALEAQDAAFFAYPDDLTSLLFDFVSRHPQSFGPTPDIA